VKGSFATALLKAKITNFRFHDLRHTAASHLVMSGAELNTVREILGHKSMQMTMRYAHLTADHKKQAVELISKRFDSVVS
jgi:integrase